MLKGKVSVSHHSVTKSRICSVDGVSSVQLRTVHLSQGVTDSLGPPRTLFADPGEEGDGR